MLKNSITKPSGGVLSHSIRLGGTAPTRLVICQWQAHQHNAMGWHFVVNSSDPWRLVVVLFTAEKPLNRNHNRAQ